MTPPLFGPWSTLRKTAVALTCFLALTLIAFPLRAQDDGPNPNVDLGVRPYESLRGGDIDMVNITNGNVVVRIPLVSYPQRGNLKLNAVLAYNNRAWRITQINCPKCEFAWEPAGSTLWNVQFDGWVGGACNETLGNFTYYQCQVNNSDGSTTPMGEDGINSGVWRALDGSGSQILWPGFNPTGNVTVIDGNGTRYIPASPTTLPYVIEDANGNTINVNPIGGVSPQPNQITDSMGRQIPGAVAEYTNFNASGCTGSNPITSTATWQVPALNGGTNTIKFCYANTSVESLPPDPIYQAKQYIGTRSLLQSIVLPNGTTWTFAYDIYADLSTITLPTGGTISYTWATGELCPAMNGVIRPYTDESRVLASRALNANDGTGPHTWTYSIGAVVSNGSTTTRSDKITDPLLNDTVYTETGLGNTCSFYETNHVQYQGSQSAGVVLENVTTNYSYSPNSEYFYSAYAPYSVFNVRPTSVVTALGNGSQRSVSYTYDSGFTYYDGVAPNSNGSPFSANYGLRVQTSESDYGNGAPGSILRTTLTNYLALSNSTYLGDNFLNLKSSEETDNSSGAEQAYTTYGYDEDSLASSGITTQHNSSPPDGTVRGNKTSVHRWLNGATVSTTECPISVSNGYLVSYTTFYDTGMKYQATDYCGKSPGDASHTTTYAYSSTYVGAYPTTVIN